MSISRTCTMATNFVPRRALFVYRYYVFVTLVYILTVVITLVMYIITIMYSLSCDQHVILQMNLCL